MRFELEDVDTPCPYSVINDMVLNRKKYDLIWLMENDEFYVGVLNAYRSQMMSFPNSKALGKVRAKLEQTEGTLMSKILRQRIDEFSTDSLIRLYQCLDLKVKIRVG